MSELTRAELKWLLTFVENYEFILDAYPELFSEEDEDDFKVVKQILQEKIDE